MKRLTTDDMRDAVAYMRATATGDEMGRWAVAENANAPRMLDCIVSFALGLANLSVEGGSAVWLDQIGDGVDEIARLAGGSADDADA